LKSIISQTSSAFIVSFNIEYTINGVPPALSSSVETSMGIAYKDELGGSGVHQVTKLVFKNINLNLVLKLVVEACVEPSTTSPAPSSTSLSSPAPSTTPAPTTTVSLPDDCQYQLTAEDVAEEPYLVQYVSGEIELASDRVFVFFDTDKTVTSLKLDISEPAIAVFYNAYNLSITSVYIPAGSPYYQALVPAVEGVRSIEITTDDGIQPADLVLVLVDACNNATTPLVTVSTTPSTSSPSPSSSSTSSSTSASTPSSSASTSAPVITTTLGGNGTCINGTWSMWTPCSVTCGAGQSERYRDQIGCDYMAPPIVEYKDCFVPCECEYSTWGEWTECTKSCDHGTRSRFRTIISNGTQGCGDYPETADYEMCNCIPCNDTCPYPLVYYDCTNATQIPDLCPTSCLDYMSQAAECVDNDECSPGCYCPFGHVLEGGECIPLAECPYCYGINGETYDIGET
jgi:hemicentin